MSLNVPYTVLKIRKLEISDQIEKLQDRTFFPYLGVIIFACTKFREFRDFYAEFTKINTCEYCLCGQFVKVYANEIFFSLKHISNASAPNTEIGLQWCKAGVVVCTCKPASRCLFSCAESDKNFRSSSKYS